MKCLYCDCVESKVIDSRSADDHTIRRRRECIGCGRRFTTYETIEVTPVLVVKNNGTREAFNAEKIRNGIIKSCEKRPVPIAVIDDMVADISKQVYNSMESEITTKAIGEMVMERLKNQFYRQYSNSSVRLHYRIAPITEKGRADDRRKN